MYLPDWYGQRYPSELDLVSCAEAIGARVVLRPLPAAAFIPAIEDTPPMVLVPTQHGPLVTAWALAHELGHLCQHSGPPQPADGDRAPGLRLMWSKNEHQANKWAACALIPEARVRHHGNASIDSFMAALSANFEDLPAHDCPQRILAHKIARHRLRALQVSLSR